MLGAAVPAIVPLKEENISRSAPGAYNAIGPAPLDKILPAAHRIGEVNDCILESFELHDVIMRSLAYFVKYIIAQEISS